MRVLPAIDILDGKVVRLKQGNYSKRVEYAQDPLKVAKQIQGEGFNDLHVIDLQGAKEGYPCAIKQIKQIVQCGLKVQVGGGIRTIETVKSYLHAGVCRVIIGSRAVEDPSFLKECVNLFGSDKVMLSVDLFQGKVAVCGWIEKTKWTLDTLLKEVGEALLKHLIVTDISKDGTLSGVSAGLYRFIVSQYPHLKVYAAGGVSSLDDIQNLKKAGVYGVIFGRAFYEIKEFRKQIREVLND